jgi:hypothetical protein
LRLISFNELNLLLQYSLLDSVRSGKSCILKLLLLLLSLLLQSFRRHNLWSSDVLDAKFAPKDSGR